MPLYTRRHYVQMADTIAAMRMRAIQAGDLFALDSAGDLEDRMVRQYRADNPRFSEQRFRDACKAAA